MCRCNKVCSSLYPSVCCKFCTYHRNSTVSWRPDVEDRPYKWIFLNKKVDVVFIVALIGASS